MLFRPLSQSDRRPRLAVRHPRPLGDPADLWRFAAQGATLGIFTLMFGAFLYFAQSILLPIVSAVVIGTMLARLAGYLARYGVPRWASAVALIVVAALLLNLAIVLLSGPVIEWIGKAPDIGASIKQKLQFLERPIAALEDLRNAIAAPVKDGSAIKVDVNQSFLAPALALLTPAMGELLLFFGTLFFFLLGHEELRQHLVILAGDREARLRTLRILNDVEQNLASYMSIVTLINLGVGVALTLGLYAIAFPSPPIWGILAFVLNYVPYLGPAVVVVVLLAVGLVTFDGLGHALVAPLLHIALTTIEGHFITPSIIGRQLTVSPLTVFLALAFWTWMWGPVGAFLATPLLIVTMVVFNHVVPRAEAPLPG
jgi:predicted PurR-regulated permease PerM